MAYTLKDHENVVSTMIYADMKMYWGKLVTPQAVQAATWLKMSMLPDYFTLLDAGMMLFGGGSPTRLTLDEVYVPVSTILAFHVLPPEEVEKDYDDNEPNREMYDVTAFCSVFRFDGKRRLSTLSDFSTAIQASKESFASMYDVTVSHPLVPSMKGLSVPYALTRTISTTLAVSK